MGRKPIPTEIKKEKGTLKKSRTIEEVKPPLSMYPDPPTYLNQYGMEVWKDTVPNLISTKLLSKIDEQLIGAYCNEMGRYNEIAMKIKENGVLFKSPKNNWPMAHPLYAVMKQSLKSATDIGVLFGITPSARTKVPSKEEDTKKAKLEKILNS